MTKEGNKCIYYIKQFFNIFLLLSGALLISIGAYIWAYTKQFTFVELTFMILGGAQVILVLLVLNSKKAMIRMKIFNYSLGIMFVALLTASILGFALKDKLVEKAAEAQENSKESLEQLKQMINDHISVALYLTLACLGIQLLCLLFSVWYTKSLETSNENFGLLYDEKEKKYMSFEDYSQRQKAQLDEKSKTRRDEMYSQNPEFYEWKMKKEQSKK